MRVARVQVEAPVTSFRYPHFLIARQASFDMPPPSTIYGHVASALGELPPPAAFRFAYNFTFVARASDLEHQHVITAGGRSFDAAGRKRRTSVRARVQPHLRDFLFRPRLTLYLDPPDLAAAFRRPAFCVVLGRSQDLAEIVRVDEIELEQRTGAYLENTLLPFSFRASVGFGVTMLMPRYIEPPPERRAHFERYIVLHDRVFGGTVTSAEALGPRRILMRDGTDPVWWVDTSTPEYHGVYRGVVFHCCAE
jgi:CRISPR-associated protein Cas5t